MPLTGVFPRHEFFGIRSSCIRLICGRVMAGHSQPPNGPTPALEALLYATIFITKTGEVVATAFAPDPVPYIPDKPEELLDYGKAFAAKKNLSEALKPSFFADLVPVLAATQSIPNPAVHDFALHMCWQYQLLPEPARTARTNIVKKTFESQLGESWESDLKEIDALDYYMRSLCIVPEVLLEDEVRFLCMQCKVQLLKAVPSSPARAAPFTEMLVALRAFLSKLKNATTLEKRNSVRQMIVDTAFSRSISKFSAFVTNVDKLLTNKAAPGFFDFVDKELAKDKTISTFCVARRCDAFENALTTFLNAVPAPAEYTAIRAEFFQAREVFNAQMAAVKLATVEALRMGIEMGDQNAHTGPLLLAAIEASRSTLDAQAQPAYMRLKTPGSKKPLGTVATAIAPDTRALWSVGKLAEWIDGPIAGTTPLDRKALLERLQAERTPTTTSQGPSVDPSSSAPQLATSDVIENQVKQVIQDALKKSAKFFLADAREMLTRATAVRIDQEQCNELTKLCTGLAELASAKEIDEINARTVFLEAERLGAIVRDSVKNAIASQKFQSSFGSALMAALAKEKVVFGKCTGGQIDCEARNEDWGFAVQHFHNRWVPGLTVYAPDGVTRLELGADQAATLYVTASSTSGFAFDVSVHLWRRRRGSSTPPGHAEQMLPPMDSTDWYDSFVTCCVLHVPKWRRTTTTTTTTTSTTTTSTAGRGRGSAQRGRGSRN